MPKPEAPEGRKLDFHERARVANVASQEARGEEGRRELATKASRAAQSPATRAKQLANAWLRLSESDRAEQLPEIRRELRRAGIIR